MSDESVLLCSDREGVRTLTLNRPRRKNAINRELWIALAQALTAAGKDSDVRAVVITGAEGAFCSGADISTPDDSHPVHKLQRLTDVALALHELSVPTIAKVNGVAVGAGLAIAILAIFNIRDICILDEDTSLIREVRPINSRSEGHIIAGSIIIGETV